MNSRSPWHWRSMRRFFKLAEDGLRRDAVLPRSADWMRTLTSVSEIPAVSLASSGFPKSEKSSTLREPTVKPMKRSRSPFVGQRNLDGRHVRVTHQPLVQVGELLVHEHEGHVEPFDVRTGGPVEQGHEMRGSGQAQVTGLASRHDVGGVVQI